MRRNLVLILVLVLSSLSGCNWTSEEVDAEEVDAGNTHVLIEIPADNPSDGISNGGLQGQNSNVTVCNPFSGPSNTDISGFHHGIYGKLKYLDDSMPRFTKVSDYQSNGVLVNADLFFSDINVPTRSFSLGFATQGGDLIKNHHGNTLYEYFSLHFETQIKLSDSDPLGEYQFALLADDGSILQLDLGSGFQPIVNNDGTHASRFKVSSTPVKFESRNTTFPLRLDYYQGPRFHIALVLLWRPLPAGGLSDSSDGKSGNSLFFDWTKVPSMPTPTYEGILARGWRPVAPENFILPSEIIENPCVGPITTTITQTNPAATSTPETHMSIQFASNYSTATFNCSLDGAPLTPCISPQNYSNLSAGSHHFAVFASSSEGSDSLGAHYEWNVLPLVTTTISEILPVESPTNHKSISFGFTSNYLDATFQCSLDGAAALPCTSHQAYDSLAEGPHQFVVYASANGTSDTSGASYFWMIDSMAPRASEITISTTSSSFTVSWTSDELTTTQLSWGAGTGTGNVVPEDIEPKPQHQVTVSGLNPFTVYSFFLGGKDQAGNIYQSSIFRVRTSQ